MLGEGDFDLASGVVLPFGNNGQSIRGAGAGLGTASQTRINYTGSSGYAFLLGGGTAGNFTRFQFLEDFELVGNANADGGIKFDGTRWCGLRRLHIRDFTKAGTVGVILEAHATNQPPNYFNRIEQCFIDNCPHGIYLRGEGTAGTGANSNVITDCSFNNCSTAGVMCDGGDTNRIVFCEFDNCTAILTAVNSGCIFNTVGWCQFDSGSGGVQVTGANAQNNHILYNTGPNFSLTDTGAQTLFEGSVGRTVPVVASAATITLPAGNIFSISGTTNITSVSASWAGRIVTLAFQGALTLTDGGNLLLAGNYVTTTNDTITLICDGTNWFEMCRSGGI
jgi:hypothetical protein